MNLLEAFYYVCVLAAAIGFAIFFAFLIDLWRHHERKHHYRKSSKTDGSADDTGRASVGRLDQAPSDYYDDKTEELFKHLNRKIK